MTISELLELVKLPEKEMPEISEKDRRIIYEIKYWLVMPYLDPNHNAMAEVDHNKRIVELVNREEIETKREQAICEMAKLVKVIEDCDSLLS